MPKTREVVRPHVKTVSAVTSDRPKRKRSSPSRKLVLNGTWEKVDPRVWKAAVKLCQGDYGRIVIESSTCVIVRNSSGRV